jgi:hypothetical protein
MKTHLCHCFNQSIDYKHRSLQRLRKKRTMNQMIDPPGGLVIGNKVITYKRLKNIRVADIDFEFRDGNDMNESVIDMSVIITHIIIILLILLILEMNK